MADQFKHKNDDGLAEAALIALAGLKEFDIKVATWPETAEIRAPMSVAEAMVEHVKGH